MFIFLFVCVYVYTFFTFMTGALFYTYTQHKNELKLMQKFSVLSTSSLFALLRMAVSCMAERKAWRQTETESEIAGLSLSLFLPPSVTLYSLPEFTASSISLGKHTKMYMRVCL